MPGFYTDGPVATDAGTIFDYEASTSEAFGAGFSRQFDTNPLAIIGRQARYLSEDFRNLAGEGERVDQETAQAEITGRGLDLKVPVGGMSRVELDMLQYLKQREMAQTSTTERSRGVVSTAAGFAGGLAASFVDPINVASGFIPFVGQARYAKWLAQAGEGVFARAAVRAGAGAIEGAAGAALIEPIVYAGTTQEQLDYGLMDSFLNVTLGGALGGGLHVIGGAVHDRAYGAPSRLRDFAGVAPEAVKRDAMQAAVAALERGDPVDVDGVFARHLGERYGVTDQEFLSRAMDFDDVEFGGARDVVVMARGGEDQAGPWTLKAIIRALGGIKVRDAAGEITREGAEVLAALGDMRAPGLINNKTGKTADYMREALMQDGWFRSQEEGLDIQGLYDLLEAEARGGRPTRIGETRGAKLKTEASAELERAGVTSDDTVRQAAVKVAEMRARELRERASIDDGDPDFEPSEIIYREPGDENDLAGPQTFEELAQFEQFAAGPLRARGVSDLIPEARADRTEDAFTRQFVDEATDAIAAEKVKPKDRIEVVKLDEADFRDVVEQYRSQGHVTEADDAALKQGDELAAWAERRAKAFEAAAGCIEAA